MFDQRVSGALRRLGIHRREEIEAMERRIEALESELSRLRGKNTARDEEE
jgi:polyhydroxyalkanoate synthesis regulator phasin